MKLTYQYKFEKECAEIHEVDLLTAFKNNFRRTKCHHKIIMKENELDLENQIFDFNYLYKMVSPWNIWYGIGTMKISILKNSYDKSYLIRFSISILRYIVFYVIINFIIGVKLMTINHLMLVYFLIFYNIVAITSIVYKYIGQKRFFSKTIRIGDFYMNQVSKSYDWEIILNKKTNSEIIEIIKGHTLLPNIVIELAKKELEKRKTND